MLWPIPPTQVAHYAAVTTGLVIVLWLGGRLRGRVTLAVVVGAGTILLLTHTRTALLAMILGVFIAGLSLIAAKARIRKFFAAAGAVMAIAIITVSSVITTWLARGEGTTAADQSHRPDQGLGSPSRLSTRQVPGDLRFRPVEQFVQWPPHRQQLAFLLPGTGALWGGPLRDDPALPARDAPTSSHAASQRALALFLVTYCLVASFTEDGFTDVTPYLLDLTLAASLLVPSAAGKRTAQNVRESTLPTKGRLSDRTRELEHNPAR